VLRDGPTVRSGFQREANGLVDVPGVAKTPQQSPVANVTSTNVAAPAFDVERMVQVEPLVPSATKTKQPASEDCTHLPVHAPDEMAKVAPAWDVARCPPSEGQLQEASVTSEQPAAPRASVNQAARASMEPSAAKLPLCLDSMKCASDMCEAYQTALHLRHPNVLRHG
jgi:hypothetical protein